MTALVAAIVGVGAVVVGMVLGVFGLIGAILEAFALVVGSVIIAFFPAI